MPPRRFPEALGQWVTRHRADILGVSAILGAAVLFLSPALKDGGSFGGFDLDTTLTSLGTGLYATVHNHTNSDAISQMVSWNTLDWHLVRSGHFPLWNDYSGLGMPQFLNFESSALSLPDLVSYAFPVRVAFLVAVFVKLVIAGTGAYAWSRVLRLRVIASTFAGLSFMLAGAFTSWVTWPLSDVVAWTGWICAFGILSYRSSGVLRHLVGLGIAIAFSIYGGFPEANVMVLLLLLVLVLALAVAAFILGRRPSPAAVVRVVGGCALGALLSAPLWFPGLQVIAGSHRESEGDYAGLPLRSLPLLISSSYLGLPFKGAAGFELGKWNYYETVSYVGVIAIVLAVVACGVAIRRPVVVGLLVALLFCLVASYEPVAFHPFQSIMDSIKPLSMVRFERMRVLTALVVSMLGAIGLDRLLEARRSRAVRRSYFIGLASMALVVGLLALNNLVAKLPVGLSDRHLRGLIWPVALLVVLGVAGIVVFGLGPARPSTERVALCGAIGLTLVQSAFLYSSGVGIASYSKAFYPETPAEGRLISIVGSDLVGMDNGSRGNLRDFGPRVGLFPEVNIGYGVRLFAIHDPVTPASYFTSWPLPVKSTVGGVSLFVPDIDSAALARRYGVGYILAKPGLPPPAGTVRVTTIAGEPLYRVPGAARFSFAPGSGDARVTSVQGSATTAFILRTTSVSTRRLVLRVTAVPGWRATVDGHSVALTTYEGVMESLVLPPGVHEVQLSYLPSRLVIGAIGALASLFAVACIAIVLAFRRRSLPGQKAPATP